MVIEDLVYVWHLEEPALVNWHSRIHLHPEKHWELHFFLSGDGTFQNGGRIDRVQGQTVFLTGPDAMHRVQPSLPGKPLSYYAVLLRLEAADGDLEAALEEAWAGGRFPRRFMEVQHLRLEGLKLRRQAGHPWMKRAALLEMEGLIWEILAEGALPGGLAEGPGIAGARTSDGALAPIGPGGGPGRPAANREATLRWAGSGATAETLRAVDVHLDRAMALLRSKVRERLRLGWVAEKLGISEEHLIRIFKRALGLSPMQWFALQKLEAAVSLLTNTEKSVKAIALELAYASPYHFSRNFKAYTGQSPREYRARYFAQTPVAIHTRIAGLR